MAEQGVERFMASRLVLVRSPYLITVDTSGANLYPLGGCRVVFLWFYVCFILFRFRIFTFTEAAAVRSIFLRSSISMRLDSQTHR